MASARNRPRSFSTSRAASSSRWPSLGRRAARARRSRCRRTARRPRARAHRTRPCPRQCARRRARQQRRAEHPGRSAEHHEPGRPLVPGRVRGAAGRGRRRSATAIARACRHRCRCRRRARARTGAARFEQQSRLQRGEADRRVGVHRVAARLRPSRRRLPTGCRLRASGTAAARTAAATIAAGPSSAPRNPVPYIASTNRSARASARSNAPRSNASSSANDVDPDASPPQHAGRDPTRRHRCCPCRTRRRLAGRTRRPASARAAAATARPARSTRTASGVPPAMARRSASAISAGVSTGSTTSILGDGGPSRDRRPPLRRICGNSRPTHRRTEAGLQASVE